MRGRVTVLLFQSTPPARGATRESFQCTSNAEFQSTPPARGATRGICSQSALWIPISIHAPREGGDHKALSASVLHQEFQSTPPARGRLHFSASFRRYCRFQSTPPARGATAPPISRMPIVSRNFNPRPPRGGRPCGPIFTSWRSSYFNPRPREGGDPAEGVWEILVTISIHAPREGGDLELTFSNV